MSDAPETIWATNGGYPHFNDDWSDGEWVNDDGCNGIPYTRTDTVEDLRNTLAVAMKLLRDNKLQIGRELNQADMDVLKQAREWK